MQRRLFEIGFLALVAWLLPCGCGASLDMDDDVSDDDVSDDDVSDDDVGDDDDDADDDSSSEDADGDGWTVGDGDCDDTDPSVNHDAQEVCGGADENCDGAVDEPGAGGCTTFYVDDDGDGYGDPNDGACVCEAVDPYVVTDATDCYDGNADAHPGQPDFFPSDRGDGSFDYDCDGQEELEWTDTFACTPGVCYMTSAGWTNGTPSCGATSDWGYECTGMAVCSTTTESRQQGCK